MYKQQLQSIISKFYDFTKVFIDGSKKDNGVGATVATCIPRPREHVETTTF